MHKKYVTRSGKKHGPYFYTCIRDKNGVPKSFYLGSDLVKARKKEKEIKAKFESRQSLFPRLAIPLVVVVLLAFVLTAGLSLTGFLVQEEVLSYTQTLNLELNETGETFISLSEYPDVFYLNSITLSGSVRGNGTARVYIENSVGEKYLVFDSTKDESGFDLTGMVTAKNMSNATNETGQNITEPENATEPEPENVTTPEENITAPENITLPAPVENITLPENDTNVTIPENITEPVPEELDVVNFSNTCMETCVLTEADGFNLSDYTLFVEVGPNTILNLDNVSYSVKNMTAPPKQVKIDPEIRDANGNLLSAKIKFLKKGNLELETDSGLESSTPPITALAVSKLDKGIYDVDIEPESHIVKKIHMKDVEIVSDITELVNLDDTPETGDFVEVYAIDPTSLNFTNATVTVTAKGNQLYKCRDWNFGNQTCEGEWTLFRTDLVPGQEYTLTLTPEDPGFGEILITKALHLDHKRNFVKDVYDYVVERDNNWTEIPKNNYLRVTFESNLTGQNDITIYARSSKGGSVEVYEKDGTDLIADFGTITNEGEYSTLLTGLQGSQDTFDLKIIGSPMEFDHIIDPSYYVNLTVDGDTGDCVFDLGSTWDQANSSDDYRSLLSGATCGWTVENWTIGGATIEDVVVFVEHVGESGIAAGSVTLYVGNSTNQSAYGSSLLSDFESVENKLENSQGASLTAEGIDTYNSSDPSTTDRLNDLVIRIGNTDVNDEAGVDHIIVQVRYSLVPPAVNLDHPPDNYYNDTDQYVNLTFNASVSDDLGLVNCSLWHNATGAWHRNQTQTVTGTTNTTSFDLNSLSNVTLIWNIECYDSSDQSAFNDTNRTVILNWTTDTDPPMWSNNETNSSSSTKTQETVYFNVTLTDNVAGGYQIFAFDDGVGTFTNDSAVSWTTPEELEEIRTITATRSQTVRWYWWFNDSVGNSNQTDTWSFTVANTAPTTPTLISPQDGNTTTNRTPSFSWNPSTDADSDDINYTLNIICVGGCSDDNREYNVTATSYTIPAELQYFGDDGYYYVWNVRAWDGFDYSGYSETRNFTVNTLVVMTLTANNINFGSMGIGQSNDTTDDNPPPFAIQNDGNCFVDVNISASDLLWDVKPSASEFFQYKADNMTGEEDSFNWSGSFTAWTNVSTAAQVFLDYFNYTDASDSAEIDLNIEVPLDEPPGDKSSSIVITGWYVG